MKIIGSTPVLERYELKFTIPRDEVDEIAAFAKPYCHMDRFSAAAPDGFYHVNSLYFDTPNFHFLENRLQGRENRFNMRVRSYGLQPVLPYFLEVKQKRGDIIRKYRARIRDENLQKVLDPGLNLDPDWVVSGDVENAALFRRLVHTYNASPVVNSSYKRLALFSHCDEYARVTFDIGLKFKAQQEYRPLEGAEDFAPTDEENCFDEGCSVILELKCYSKHVPLWMVDLIRKFKLRRRGFSKYSAALAQVFRQYRFDDSNRMSPLVRF